MTTPASAEGATGTESQSVIAGFVLGQCLWCGHSLVYARPGNPPADCMTDAEGFYTSRMVWRDLSLIDFPLVFGKFCPAAPPHPLGQFSIHQLVRNIEQP